MNTAAPKPGFTVEEILATYRAGNHVTAIKMLRAETGCGLREAVDALRDGKLSEMPTFAALRLRGRAERNAMAMFTALKRVSMLNRDAGEIGPGMLAGLVDEANAIISIIEKEP